MSTRSVLSALLISLFTVAALTPTMSAEAAPKRKKPRAGKKAEKKEEPAEPPESTPEPAPSDAAAKAAPTVPTGPTVPTVPTVTPPAQPGATPSPSSDAAGANDRKNDEAPPEDVPGDADVDSLRQEYLKLRDELFKSRARANTVASQLYSTRVQIKLTYTTARHYNPAKSTIRLDGASVYEDASGAIAGDDGIRFDGYVAPGRHVITFRVEATGKDDDSFTSVTETQIIVKAVAGKDLVVAAKAKDSGDIAYQWKRGEAGSYGLGIDTSVRTIARAEGATATATKKKAGK